MMAREVVFGGGRGGGKTKARDEWVAERMAEITALGRRCDCGGPIVGAKILSAKDRAMFVGGVCELCERAWRVEP